MLACLLEYTMRILIGMLLQGYEIRVFWITWNLSYLYWKYWNAVSVILIRNLKESVKTGGENCKILTVEGSIQIASQRFFR